MTDIVFLDTETTGLHPENHFIWEFAGIKRNVESGEETRMLFQIGVPLDDADPFALNIGHFWERYGKNGDWEPEDFWDTEGYVFPHTDIPQRGELVSASVAAGLIRHFTHGAHLVANCVSFDAERMARLLYSESLLPTWHYHVLDIEPMIVGYARARGVSFSLPYSSSDISAWLGVEEPSEEERHTAMGDAEWVKRMWDAIHD